jgi:hypothetical protein
MPPVNGWRRVGRGAAPFGFKGARFDSELFPRRELGSTTSEAGITCVQSQPTGKASPDSY